MRYVYDLTVPANTLETAPAEETVKLIKGTITGTKVRFLRGPHNQVEVEVLEGIHRILPVVGSEPINGDGQIWSIPMKYELVDPPYELTLRGWSPDTRYQHKITFFFDLDPKAKEERNAIMDFIFGKGKGV